ncbi:MAG: hypothetical protein PF692_15905 [Kiritimatiellae bacterium]|jgi:hypothetical protein|nr:hypothetical protein [Kiritimatiellia bacterium]
MGLLPLKPGYSEVQLKPVFDAFDFFDASCCIPQGVVKMAWNRLSKKEFALQINIPNGTVASVVIGNKVEKITKTAKLKCLV